MILDEALEKKAITSQDIDRIDQIIHSEKMDTTTEIAEQKKNKSVSENKVTFNWNPDNCSFISMLSEVNDYSFEKVFAFHLTGIRIRLLLTLLVKKRDKAEQKAVIQDKTIGSVIYD